MNLLYFPIKYEAVCLILFGKINKNSGKSVSKTLIIDQNFT